MRLFLTVITHSPASIVPHSSNTVSSPDTVALFDDGVWTSSGPSPSAVSQVSATFVAQQILRQAALTELIHSTNENVVCFRYGARPPLQRDFVFFCKHRASLPDLLTSSSALALQSAESTGMSSPLITPSGSLNSGRLGRSLPSLSSAKSVEQTALPVINTAAKTVLCGNADVYESFFSLWLLEIVSEGKLHVTVSGCLFFVNGTVVDLGNPHDVHAPLNINTGATRVLRCAADVQLYLEQCEHTVKELMSQRSPPVPYHMWVTVRVGGADTSGNSRTTAGEFPSVSFLDLASPVASAKGGNSTSDDNNARVREQLRLFELQIGTSTPTATSETSTTQLPSPFNTNDAAADRRWLGFLQSCNLPRARKVGIFSLTQRVGTSVFDVSTEDLGGNPFTLSAELRQRALEDAVNNGIVHPLRVSTRERTRRSKKKTKAKKVVDGDSLPTSASVKSASPASQQTESIPVESPQVVLAKHAPVSSTLYTTKSVQSGGEASESDNHSSSNTNTARAITLFALLEAEECVAREALADSEARARNLVCLRWSLRAHPPNVSVTDVARQLWSTASRLKRPNARSAPQRRPPPLTLVDLTVTARVPFNNGSGSNNHHKAFSCTKTQAAASPAAWPTRTLRSPEAMHEVLPLISAPPSTLHAISPMTSPSYRPSTLTPLTVQQTVHPGVSRQVGGHHEHLHRVNHNGINRRPVSSQNSATGSRTTSGTRRRYSAIDVALLEQSHTCNRRSSTTTSPHKGNEVELLYPLVCTFHAEVKAQNNVMAEELMARSRIELREMNRRRTMENLAAERRKLRPPHRARLF